MPPFSFATPNELPVIQGKGVSWLERTSGEHAVIPDSPAAEPYNRLARVASRALRAPVGLVTLLDGERETVAACVGIDRTATDELDLPSDFVIDDCGIERVDCIVFGDPFTPPSRLSSWRHHPRRARAYIRVPLVGSDDEVRGSLCIADFVSRRWDDDDVACLRDLANSAMTDAARRLRESEERYQRLVGLSHDAILVHAHGRVVYANAAAAKLLGIDSPGALENRAILELVHPDDRDIVRKRTRYVLANHAPSEKTEFRFVRPDGTIIAAEVSGTCIPYRGTDAVLVVCRDISERTASDLLIRMTEEQIQAVFNASTTNDASVEPETVGQLFDQSPDFVGLADATGEVRYLNAAARTLIGLAPDAPLDRLVTDSFHPANVREQLDAVALPTALIAGSWSGDSALICGDGSIRPTWQTLIAHRDATGALKMLSIVMRAA